MNNRLILCFLFLLSISSLSFAKQIVLEHGKFPDSWNVSYVIDGGKEVKVSPPVGLWSTASGKLQQTIDFKKVVEFKTTNPKTYMKVMSDGVVVGLYEEGGKPAWSMKNK